MKSSFLSVVMVLAIWLTACSQPTITFQEVIAGLNQPVDIADENTGAKRLFIVEQTGTIRIVEGSTAVTTPFLDITNSIIYGGERGLLSMAFHPNYATNGYFYVWYNAKTSGNVTLARYTRSSTSNDVADPASGVILLQISKRFSNHNGAKINFGPDGYLYVATGDGGSGGDPDRNGQNPNSLLGKMLRLDVSNPAPPYYSIPPTNPYVNNPSARPEVLSIGLRNPWRWSFDKATGDIWMADVGQDLWEEVDHVAYADRMNRNYGWNCMEGTHQYYTGCTAGTNTVTPVFDYGHNSETGGYSITGGYVYRGTEFPQLQGYYLCTDYVTGNGWLIKPDGAGGYNTTLQKNWVANITSFGEKSDGSLYAVAGGKLYKVIAASALPTRLVSFLAGLAGLNHEIAWTVANETAGDVYTLEQRKKESDPFLSVYKTQTANASGNNRYAVKIPASAGNTWYRLQIQSADGSKSYSSIVSITGKATSSLRAVIISNTLQVTLPPRAKMIRIFDAEGKSILTKPVSNSVAERISLNAINKGVLAIQVQIDNSAETIRVLY